MEIIPLVLVQYLFDLFPANKFTWRNNPITNLGIYNFINFIVSNLNIDKYWYNIYKYRECDKYNPKTKDNERDEFVSE